MNPERLSEVIGKIYDLTGNFDNSRRALAATARTIDASFAVLANIGRDETEPEILATHGINRYLARLAVTQSIESGCLDKTLGASLTGAVFDITPPADLRSQGFLCGEVPGPKDGVFSCGLGSVISASPSRFSVLCLFRGPGSSGFSKKQEDKLGLLIDHWRRAREFDEEMLDYKRQALSSEAILDSAPFGILLLSRSGRILYMNPYAEQTVSDRDGMGVRSGQVSFLDPDNKSWLTEMLHRSRMGAMSGSQALPVKRPSGKPGYQLLLMEAYTQAPNEISATGPVMALFIYDPADREPVHTDTLQSLNGLTEAEARVCASLYREKTVNKVAESLQISVNTVRTHLAHTYDKIGVSSQSELMQYLAQAPKIKGSPPDQKPH